MTKAQKGANAAVDDPVDCAAFDEAEKQRRDVAASTAHTSWPATSRKKRAGRRAMGRRRRSPWQRAGPARRLARPFRRALRTPVRPPSTSSIPRLPRIHPPTRWPSPPTRVRPPLARTALVLTRVGWQRSRACGCRSSSRRARARSRRRPPPSSRRRCRARTSGSCPPAASRATSSRPARMARR
jgi:hypothetical protein